MCLITVSLGLTVHADSPPQFVFEARQVANLYQNELKKTLMTAMSSGGPKMGIEVCKERAVDIAQEVSRESQWNVSRVSLKTRNANNQPNESERKVLEHFEVQVAKSKSAQELEWWEAKSGQQIYMKAIPTHGLCLTCHGDKVDPEIEAVISKYYPQDKARGYVLGELRGAFVLDRILDYQQSNEK